MAMTEIDLKRENRLCEAIINKNNTALVLVEGIKKAKEVNTVLEEKVSGLEKKIEEMGEGDVAGLNQKIEALIKDVAERDLYILGVEEDLEEARKNGDGRREKGERKGGG